MLGMISGGQPKLGNHSTWNVVMLLPKYNTHLHSCLVDYDRGDPKDEGSTCNCVVCSKENERCEVRTTLCHFGGMVKGI